MTFNVKYDIIYKKYAGGVNMAFDLVDYKAEYTKTHYDIIKAELPKGYKDKLKKLASENGMSMAAYIRCLIDEKYID